MKFKESRRAVAMLTASLFLVVGLFRPAAVCAQEAQPSNAELLKKIEELGAKVQQLEKKVSAYEAAEKSRVAKSESASRKSSAQQLLNQPVPIESPANRTAARNASAGDPYSTNPTSEGSQSSSKSSLFGLGSNSNSVLSFGAYGEFKFGGVQTPDQGWTKGFDAGRVTLLPTLQVAPNIIFNAELEF